MKLSKTLKTYLDQARTTDSYWVEHAKLEFAVALDKQRQSAKMSYAAIAKHIGTSAAYITKVFRGDTNMTIETMVKLARSAGGQIDIRVVDSASAVSRWDLSHLKTPLKIVHTLPRSSNSVTHFCGGAANHDTYEWERAAA